MSDPIINEIPRSVIGSILGVAFGYLTEGPTDMICDGAQKHVTTWPIVKEIAANWHREVMMRQTPKRETPLTATEIQGMWRQKELEGQVRELQAEIERVTEARRKLIEDCVWAALGGRP